MYIRDHVYSVDVSVRRVGGAYGAKITRAHWIAAACGLAAHTTRRSTQHSIPGTTYYVHINSSVVFTGQYVCIWILIQT